MSKPIVFFPHDTNSRNDQRLQKLIMKEGMRGLGIYWSIIEMLHENIGTIELKEVERIAFELHEEYERITNVIEKYELFEKDDSCFWSDRVKRNILDIIDKSKKAKASVEARWNKYKNTTVSNNDTTVILSEEKKEEKNKEDIVNASPPAIEIYPFKDFWNDYGKKIDTVKCEAKWGRITNIEKKLIKEKLPVYISATPDIQFRKNPLTYLNGKMWLDDHVPKHNLFHSNVHNKHDPGAGPVKKLTQQEVDNLKF